MLKIIKKALLLSSFAYSFVFPMRQVVQVALAKTVNQSAAFRNSLIERCPFIPLVGASKVAEDVITVETKAETNCIAQDVVKVKVSNDGAGECYKYSQKISEVDKKVLLEVVSTYALHNRPRYRDIYGSGHQDSELAWKSSSDIDSERSSDTASDNTVNTVNKNIPENNQNIQAPSVIFDQKPQPYTDQNKQQVATSWQRPSSQMDLNHARNDMQNEQYMSKLASRVKAEQMQEAYLENAKAQLSASNGMFSTNVEKNRSLLMNFYSSLSNSELQVEIEGLAQSFCSLTQELQSLTQQNSKVDSFVNPEKHGLIASSSAFTVDTQNNYARAEILRNAAQSWTSQDYYIAKEGLALKEQIESIKTVIQGINSKLSQDSRDFAHELSSESLDQIEKVISDYIAKKEALAESIVQEERALKILDAKINETQDQLDYYKNKFFLSRWLNSNLIKDLKDDQKSLDAEEKAKSKELRSLLYEQKENSERIAAAQKVVDQKKVELQEAQLEKERQEQKAKLLQEQEKQAQEARLLQEQEKQDQEARFVQEENDPECGHEQETVHFYDGSLPSQYALLDISLANCSDPVVQKLFRARQEALAKTLEQGGKKSDKAFVISTPTLGYLAAHDINYKEIQRCFGTEFQHQLHGEMCDIFERAAAMQAELPYKSNLLRQSVLCADAGHDANKSEKLSTVVSLNNLGYALLNTAEAYGTALATGAFEGVQSAAHNLVRLDETIQTAAKAIYYVFETAALNSYSEEDGFEDLYIPLRDQRNAEIIAGLQNLGDKIQTSTGPQRVQAITCFLVDFYVSGKVSNPLCEILVGSETAVLAGAGYAKSEMDAYNAAQKLTTMAHESNDAQKVINEVSKVASKTDVAKTAQKVEALAQERIVQKTAQELLEAEKSLDKAARSVAEHGVDPVRQSKATPPRTFKDKADSALRKAELLADKDRTRELLDGRIRYYFPEDLSTTPGPTRGRSFVVENNPKTNLVRAWHECYDHAGKVNRVRPTMINGRPIDSQHYPATYKDILENIKGSKWRIPDKTLD